MFLAWPCFAQEHNCGHKHHNNNYMPCYIDEVVNQNIRKNPEIMNQYLVHEENVKQIIAKLRKDPNAFRNNSKTDTLIDGKRIIPVVFHVIHKGGIENISKEQILDAIEKINLDYSRQNEDTAATYPLFKPRAADCQMEFRLAQIDPYGNCTDGIDRVYDPATDYAQYNVMRENSWPYSMYMNVYAVSFIYPEGMTLPEGALIGGLSPFTPDNMLSGTGGDTLLDGVLIRHDCVGTIGTATDFAGIGMNNQNRVFTHESGHFFNLYHPFQNLVATILGMDNCTSMPFLGINGDEIDDTPPVFEATQGCPPLDQNTCSTDSPDEPDMVQNFMDYASGWCQNLFSVGQLERINSTLESTRRNLWSYENLVATGVLESPELCAPVADFYWSNFMTCEGGQVSFTDWSFNGEADAWEWTFEGGTPGSSTEQNPTVTYDTEGVYSVTLNAINASGNNELTKEGIIYVYNTENTNDLPLMETFETPGATNSYIIQNAEGLSWEETDTAAYEGTRCLRLANYALNARFSADEFITEPYDLTQISPDVTPRLKFRIAYAGKRTITSNPIFGTTDTSDIYDGLQVYLSYDCGQTWFLRYNKIGFNLATVDLQETSFAPASQDDWRNESISIMAYTDYSNVRFKFVFINNGGNNLYIDNINIESEPVGIEDMNECFDLRVQPNPFNEEAKILFNIKKAEYVSLKVYDMLGKEVLDLFGENLNPGEYSYRLSNNQLEKTGMYVVRLSTENEIITKKIILE